MASPKPASNSKLPSPAANSFYNETLGEGIYPTPVIGIVGILEDVHKAVRPEFLEAGRVVVLLSGTDPGDLVDAESAFGSSEYAKTILGALWGYPPALELEKEASLQKALIEGSSPLSILQYDQPRAGDRARLSRGHLR